jgi:hypothetical protein
MPICYCQTTPLPKLPLQANKIIYTAKITTGPSVNKERLFSNAQDWYRHNYESADNTFIINNIDQGIISGTGIIHTRKHKKGAAPGDLFFNVAILAGKGSYEYTIDSIYTLEDTTKVYYSDMYNEALYPPAKTRWPQNYKTSMLLSMDERITAMIEKLKADMLK